MTRTLALVCCWTAALTALPPTAAVAQTRAAESSVTLTATVEAIDKANRTVMLKGSKGNTVEVAVSKDLNGFDSLRVGDKVDATYFEAVALNLRKPGAPAPPAADPLATTIRKDRAAGSETRRQRTFTANVTAVDSSAPSVTLKGPDGRVVSLAVRDPKELQAVKVGDAVDVTYYESLLVKVARSSK